jgi:iron complex outermembrane recepter protein
LSRRRPVVFALAASWLFAGPVVAQLPVHAPVVSPPVVVVERAGEWPGQAPGREDVLIPVVVEVTADGSVSHVEVDDEVQPELASAAVEAARHWTFRPAERDGAPVAARIRARVRFVGAGAPSVDEPRATPPAAPVETPPHPPQEIVVVGEQHAPRANSASDFTIRPGQLRDVPRRSAEEMLTFAPGFNLSNHGGALHPSAIFLRGFDAAEGQDVEFSLSGVPLNDVSNAHGHGFADTHFIIPELVSTLRVVEGPFDPRQGDFAVAGSAAFDAGLDARGVLVKGKYGSFDTKRLTLLWGPAKESARTYAGAQFEQSSGFGPNRAHRAARFMLGYERALGSGASLQLTAQSYAGQYDSAGVLRRDDYDARRLSRCAGDADSQFFCFYDPNQGGGVSRHAVSAKLVRRGDEAAYTLQLFATSRQLRSRENFTGFVSDVQPTGQPQRGDGVEQIYGATMVGSRGSYTVGPQLWGHRQEVEVGYFLRYDDATSSQRRLRRTGGEPYKEDFDNRLRVSNLSAYVAGRLRPFGRLILRAGARLDTFAFAVADRNRPTLDRQGTRLGTDYIEAFGFAVQPRASAEVVLERRVSLLAAYGVGARSSDAQALSQGEFAPFARVQAVDLGLVVKDELASELSYEARAVGFYTHVDKDLLFDETAGRNVFVGASARAGALLSGRLTHPWGLDVAGNVTYAEAYLVQPASKLLGLGGPRLPYIPRWVARLDASLRRPFRAFGRAFDWGLALGASYVAPRPLPLNQVGTEVAKLDAAARLRYQRFELGLEVTNLFDARYHEAEFYYASDFSSPDAPASQLASQLFTAGAPRTVLASLLVHFGAD